MHYAGVAIGIVATFGYLPEIFAPLLAGILLDSYEGMRGYSIYFSIMIGVAVLGILFCVIWIRRKKEEK